MINVLSCQRNKPHTNVCGNIIIDFPAPTTGSYGCFMKMDRQSKLSILTVLFKNKRVFETLNIFGYASPTNRILINKDRFRDYLTQQGCTTAVKVFRAKFNNPGHTTEEVFLHELEKVGNVKKSIGHDLFGTFTTYRCFDDMFAFSIEPNEISKVKLSIRHKPDFEEEKVGAIYFMLQESCKYSLDDVITGQAKETFDAEEFEQNMSRIIRIMHERGIVHSDIKPQNIVFCPFSQIKYKLIDYGFALDLNHLQVPLKKLAGTRAYMSPYAIGLFNQVYMKNRQNQEHLTVYNEVKNMFTNTKYKAFYATLVRSHITSINRSKQYHKLEYILKKNDEYALMMTLFQLYIATRDTSLLAQATVLSLSTPCFFCDK